MLPSINNIDNFKKAVLMLNFNVIININIMNVCSMSKKLEDSIVKLLRGVISFCLPDATALKHPILALYASIVIILTTQLTKKIQSDSVNNISQ